MGKFVKYTGGIVLTIALIGASVKWPMEAVSAGRSDALEADASGSEERTGGGISGENGVQSGAAQGSESGEASGNGGSQDGAGESGSSQESESGETSGNGGLQSGTGESGAVQGSENGEASGNGGSGEGAGESGSAQGSENGEESGNGGSGEGAGESGSAQGSESGEASGNGGIQEGVGASGNVQGNQSGGESGASGGAGDTQSGDDTEPGEAGDPSQGEAWSDSETGDIDQGAAQGHSGGSRTSGAMDEETAAWIEEAGEALTQIAAEREIMALIYLSDEYPVRTQASYDSGTAVTVLSGQMVNLLDVYVDDAPEVWYYVQLEYRGQTVYGYVPRTYLACSDTRFLEWEGQYGLNFEASLYTIDTQAQAVYPDIEQFPESYRSALNALKENHPNWTFVKMNTTLDWQTTITEELKDGRSLVYKTFPEWAKEGLYDTGNWYYASEAVLKVYMDPRNSLTEDAIFQFEQLTYNEAYHTLEAVNAFLKNTFMNDSKNAPGSESTYANLFWTIGKEPGREVSPFHLAARVLQEQGAGTSPLISGTYQGYEGYYNYFNVGATGTTDQQVIESGLKYAKEHDWKGAEAAIKGGADFISANYIKKGQDTLYLQKYNVNPNGSYKPYTHQYMQNISAPTTEALSIKRLYAGAGALDSTFVFKIPVYENMPGESCAKPSVSTNVTLELPKGYTDTTMWLDGVACQGEVRNGNLIATAPDGKAQTAVLYKYSESGIPVGMYVWSLSYSGVSYTATPQPGLENLLTYHGFSIRITGKSGIRFKTGISTDVRAKLLTTGVDGYQLKEYGTLITSNANLSQLPMVVGGNKIAGGISYGTDSDGNRKDVVLETVDGRYRFTSVLVGLPVEQYKTDFAFRGYAILEKGGVQTIVYGPVVARNIYALAKQLQEQGTYEAGSEADTFVKKLIQDADALEKQAAAGE